MAQGAKIRRIGSSVPQVGFRGASPGEGDGGESIFVPCFHHSSQKLPVDRMIQGDALYLPADITIEEVRRDVLQLEQRCGVRRRTALGVSDYLATGLDWRITAECVESSSAPHAGHCKVLRLAYIDR